MWETGYVNDFMVLTFTSTIYNNLSHLLNLSCTYLVTAVVIKSVENITDAKLAYERAIAADSSNEKILNQFDFFLEAKEAEEDSQDCPGYSSGITKRKSSKEDDISKNICVANNFNCILCTDAMCEKCKLKNTYRDILSRYENADGGRDLNSLDELSDILLGTRCT